MSEYHRLIFWTKALNLPGFQVVHERRDAPSDPVRFTVVPIEKVAVCPKCGHACATVHRRHESAPIKDLPLGEQNVELIVHTPQYECERCQSYFTPTYPAIAPGAHATQRFFDTLTNWLDKIANYFVTRSSNGRTERFNHALRSILWRAFGMTNFRHFRLRALHRFGRPANA